ncbi:MAG: HAMP domain-containing histidine kinase, partial [Oscillospiraceae bacterium]|nr:HAMP domain-containing histidine kinase [Oscillospiraceae bacterium]
MTTAKQREGRVPFFRSIQAKYALTYLLVVAAILIVMNTYPVLMAENMVFTSKQSTLTRQALVIGSTLSVSETLTREGVEQTMALLEEAQGTRVLVTDASARILYDSSTLDNRLGDWALMGEVAAALRGHDASRCEYRDGAILTRAAVPVMYHGMTLGAVYLYEHDAEQAQVLLSIVANLRYISIVICVVALVLVLLLSKTLTRNTVRLLSAIRRVREGEYSHRVESLGKDEMAQLADEFNQLTHRLQTTEEARRRFVSDASHELKTPLASIRLLTDSILQNDSVDMDTVREFVADIGEEADRLTRISEHLLALTRLDAGEERPAEPVELGAVAGKVAHLLTPLARKARVELQLRVEP